MKENNINMNRENKETQDISMLRVYVAGPYSGPDVITILNNMRRGMRLSYNVLKAGMAPFCPHFDYQFSLIGETSLNEYYAYSIAWLRASDCVLLIPGWEKSAGTKRELEIASALGIPVFETIDELIAWRDNRESERCDCEAPCESCHK